MRKRPNYGPGTGPDFGIKNRTKNTHQRCIFCVLRV